MRTVHVESLWDEAEWDRWQHTDFKASGLEALEDVDKLLLPHGLEIVMPDGVDDDAYHWRIEKRQEKK